MERFHDRKALFLYVYSMQIIIRNMMLSDAGAVNDLSTQLGYSLSVAETSANVQKLLSSKNDCCRVAVNDSTVVGWIHAFVAYRIESGPFVEIGGLVVNETRRSQGIGKRLTDEVKSWCFQKEIFTLRVRSNVKRSGAHRFYENLGFEAAKEQKVFEMRLR